MGRVSPIPKFVSGSMVYVLRTCIAGVACTAVASQSCTLRLINEAPEPTTLYADGAVLDTQVYHGVGGYVSFPCTTGNLSIAMGASFATQPWPWPAPVTPPSTQFTAFATLDSFVTRNLQLMLLTDVDTALDDDDAGANIDMCLFRVLSGSYNAVLLAGVAAECYGCLHPPLLRDANGAPVRSVLNSGDATDYLFMSCAWPWSMQVTDNSTNMVSQRVYTLSEHGAYTIVVGNLESAAPGTGPLLSDVVTDTAGRWPYTPIFVAMAVLIGLGILHRVVGAMLVCSRCYAPPPEGEISVWNPFTVLGYDDLVRAAMAREAAAEKRGADADLRSSLLGGDAPATSFSQQQRADEATDSGMSTKPRSSGRIRSIDTFRGACLCIMIFVNYGAGAYEQMDHSKWNGLQLADLVFPCFVFTQGVSMAISFASERRKGVTSWQLTQKTVLRAFKLFALGCFLNGGGTLKEWRFLGVLQYFAVGYLVVGLLEALVPGVATAKAAETASYSVNGGDAQPDSAEELAALTLFRSLWQDIGRHFVQWIVMLGLGALYFFLHFFLPVPGCPTGYAGPGGLADNGAYLNAGCTGGAHRYIDIAIFGERHIYHDLNAAGQPVSAATCASIYECDVHDPEGVVGWISAAWMTFLGLQAGRIFVNYGKYVRSAGDTAEARVAHTAMIARLAVWGLVLGLTGSGLAGFAKNTGAIPINKNLWSPSFVLTLAGLADASLAVFYFLVDVLHHWSGAPFCYIGMNSILIYCGHELLQGLFPFELHVGAAWASHTEAITSNITGVATWLLVARILYLQKFFVVI